MEMQLAYIKLVFITLYSLNALANFQHNCPGLPTCVCNEATTFVYCINAGFTSIPELPRTTRVLKLKDNNVTIIPSLAFSNLSNMTDLFLIHNQVRYIKPYAFAGLRNLIQIGITGDPLSCLENYSFANIPNLQTLKLLKNDINHNAEKAFDETSSLKYINLDSNELDAIPSLGYQPHLRDIILNANVVTDAKFPESFRNGSRRLAISLANNHLQSVTNITFRSLGNVTLTHLHLSNNNISDVQSGLFEDVSVIESLRLKNNPLTTSALKNVATGLTGRSLNDLDLSGVFRPGDDIQAVIASFEIIPLKTLKLRSNSISILTQNMFVKLNQLLELDLAQNKVLSTFYSAFNGLTNLLTLNIFDISLQFVPKHLPSSLVTLYLNKNKIQTIKRNTFISAPNLKRLILRDNQIRNLQQRAFSGLTNLQELDLAVNHIVQLPVKIFRSLQNLTFLDLRENNLKYIYSKSPFESLVSLRVLHFEDNECSVLPKNVFKSMKSLTSLHLNGNNLSVILSGTKEVLLFEGLNKLEDIYIASNHLSTLPEYIFRHQTSLDILHMENNKISILNSKLFRFTKKLKSLDLSSNKITVINKENVFLYLNDNPFMCDCELLWFREWIDQTKISLPSKQSTKGMEWQEPSGIR